MADYLIFVLEFRWVADGIEYTPLGLIVVPDDRDGIDEALLIGEPLAARHANKSVWAFDYRLKPLNRIAYAWDALSVLHRSASLPQE